MRGTVSSRAYIPATLFTDKDRKSLTYIRRERDIVQSSEGYADVFGYKESVKRVIRGYTVAAKGKRIGLPRDWAAKRFSGIRFKDLTVFPEYPMDLPLISPRDEKQKVFFNQINKLAQQTGPRNLLINAMTGSGKSIAAIQLGRTLQTRTLIVVDSNKIAAGFMRNFDKLFGKGWAKKNVGRIQRDQCDYEDKPFCIAMVQSLVSRKYPREAYRAFGCVVFDEVQVFASRYYQALGMFPARVQVGMTATNKAGRFGKIITDHLGKPSVVSKQQVLVPKAFIIRNQVTKLYNTYSDNTLITSVCADKSRNAMLTELLLQRGYKRERVCLILSDRISQLMELQNNLAKRGVPRDKMGLHVGEHPLDSYTVTYSYDGERELKLKAALTRREAVRASNQLNAFQEVPGITLPTALQKKLDKGEEVIFSVAQNTYKPSEDELDNIANYCMLIFASYRIFSKGVDYPRIDMGIEASPIGNVTQPLGRTLRLAGPDKPIPEWYAIHDRHKMPKRTGFDTRWEVDKKISDTMNDFFDKKSSVRETSLLKAKASIRYESGRDYKREDQ